MIPTVSVKRAGLRVCLLSLCACALSAQVPNPVTRCQVLTTPLAVSAEGLTERVGDVVLECAANPGASVSTTLALYLSAPVTNRVDGSNNTRDAVLSVDLGSGFVPTGIPGLISGNSITFAGVNYPAPANGTLRLRISNVRAAMNRLGYNSANPAQVTASLSTSLPIDQSQLVVAYSQAALLSNMTDTTVSCYGSPAPDTLDLPSFFAAGTALASTRVTEGFATAFAPNASGADSGTRIIVRYSGFPGSARLYIPDGVAGSTAIRPTSGGDLNLPPATGQYMPGSHTLLMLRVLGADSTGAGGSAAPMPMSLAPITLASVSEVPLSNGSGFAVYEVVDSNPNVQETAQFPTFFELPRFAPPSVANETVALGPISSVTTASTNAPVPRFTTVDMLSDCTLLRDCAAPVVRQPRLSLESSVIHFTGVAGASFAGNAGKFLVHNEGGGTMDWKVSIIYSQGSDWLSLSTTSGSNEGTVQVTPKFGNLPYGIYNATIVVDAGTAGMQSVAVNLLLSQPAPPPVPAPDVSQVLNAATLDVAPLVAGSLTTLMGSNLGGKNVAVTFDGAAATLFYTSATQINLLVPSLGSKTSASVVVTADGVSSKAVNVPVASAWPAIFAHGVLNQDWRENLPQTPAAAGEILQIFATGIPASATVSAQIGDRKNLVPVYAGEAPNFHGLQQVNVAVPQATAGPTTLKICATMAGQEVCSPAVQITVR